MRLWMRISKRSQVLVPSPQGDLRVTILSFLVGRRTGPDTLSFFSTAPFFRSAQTAVGLFFEFKDDGDGGHQRRRDTDTDLYKLGHPMKKGEGAGPLEIYYDAIFQVQVQGRNTDGLTADTSYVVLHAKAALDNTARSLHWVK